MTHPLVVRNNQVHRNLYYTPPEQFLSLTCDEHEVQEMLENIEHEGEVQKRIRFLSNVLRLSSQPFSASYPDGRMMYCNSAFCTLSGYSEDELRTMTWRIDITPPHWRELERRMLRALDRTGQPQRYEKEIIRKDGSRVAVEVFIHRICGEKGEVQCHYAFITDITERKRAERQLRRQRDKALERARELSSQHY
jgi:PAS domain S-box-containing protein